MLDAETGATTEANLHEFRIRAACCSGGTSHEAIKELVLGVIFSEKIQGKILDYGAGTGELVRILDGIDGIEVTGVDIFPKPDDLQDSVHWYQQDLNSTVKHEASYFDAIICSEVIEHLENPRAVFRDLKKLLKPSGKLILTTPNQENIRSFLTLIFRGHFAQFVGSHYPAHITALLSADLVHLCEETGFLNPKFIYTNRGWFPGVRMTWQQLFGKWLRGKWFSDNVGMVAIRSQKL